jgi:DNA-binding transcriptional MerR regulator
MATSNFRIGDVATRLRISVRALRHYDEIGLLKPASRSATGHRLYTDSNIARLRKIVALRKTGFSLDHIYAVLSGDTAKAFKTLQDQAGRLRKQIAQQQETLRNVEGVLESRDMHPRFTQAETERLRKRSAEYERRSSWRWSGALIRKRVRSRS